MSKSLFIEDLAVDREITDYFMAKEISVKVGSNKKNYLDMTLADRSGEINAKKWNLADEELEGLSRIGIGDTVKIKGLVTEWNNVKQLKIIKLRKAQKEDGLDLNDFIKAAPRPCDEMYADILAEARAISDPDLRAIAEKCLLDEKDRLLYYPAASKNHHSELGGLLWHMTRMLEMGKKACEVYSMMNRDWVVCGVIIHDIEKLNEIASNEMGISPGYTMEGQLLGHIAQGVKRIDRMARELSTPSEKAIMLEHMVLSHHYEPEFGSPKKPMFPEAELLHYLDMMDAKFYDFEDALGGVDPGSFSERVRTLDGRMLYRPTFSEK